CRVWPSALMRSGYSSRVSACSRRWTNSSLATTRTSSWLFHASPRSWDTWALIWSMARASAVSAADVAGGAAGAGAVVVVATEVGGAELVDDGDLVATVCEPPLRTATAPRPTAS